MMPNVRASAGTRNGMHDSGTPMIPSTSEATANPLLVPAASRVVPSIVKGMPQLLQLLAVIGLSEAQRGHSMVWLLSDIRIIFGARSPAAAYAWTGCGSCLTISLVIG